MQHWCLDSQPPSLFFAVPLQPVAELNDGQHNIVNAADDDIGLEQTAQQFNLCRRRAKAQKTVKALEAAWSITFY